MQDLLKKITNKDYKVDHTNLQDKRLLYDFAEGMHFDEKAPGKKAVKIDHLYAIFCFWYFIISQKESFLKVKDPQPEKIENNFLIVESS